MMSNVKVGSCDGRHLPLLLLAVTSAARRQREDGSLIALHPTNLSIHTATTIA